MTTSRTTVGIIGAGISGLVCARKLMDRGFDVRVFDKGRSTGGRTATRRVEPDLAFDHGAQYFTVRDSRFQSVTDDWLARGVVAKWPGRIVCLRNGVVEDTSPLPRYVGVPGMSAMAADLARGIDVRTNTLVKSIIHEDGEWRLTTDASEPCGHFDALVISIPAPQSVGLLQGHSLSRSVATVTMTPCWAVMVAFESRLECPWDGAFIHGSPLSWAARNSSKPGRTDQADCWVLHASAEWSSEHIELLPEQAATRLLAAFSSAIEMELPPSIHVIAHRWRYSHGSDLDARRSLHDPETNLALCGDWLAGGRVEGAFVSGLDAADQITGL